MSYDHKAVESKWAQKWEADKLFWDTAKDEAKDKMYLLFAFAYPSGSGLHVGHVESNTALDILARYYRMKGKQVFFPVGWDAFGLPAENFAIKTGVPPAVTTHNAIKTFEQQLRRIGISYDWANEIATNHPGYYKWTQWIFLQLYNKGLAYKGKGMVNWCPSCQTVLANEQVVDGECERCGTAVIQKDLEQWYFKITDYKDELISGLDQVDWPKATKDQQLNWIGKSEGTTIRFSLASSSLVGSAGPRSAADASPKAAHSANMGELEVFTTAHDTIFGCTFLVVSPEHLLLSKYREHITNIEAVEKYIDEAKHKTELERQSQKDKTGVCVKGLECVNPINGKRLPIYVADYVLGGYGTGAIMAVPGEDERDFIFAQKYELPVIYTTSENEFVSYAKIKADRKKYTLINSGEFDGMNFDEGRIAILKRLEELGVGESKNQYKLRDWLISRQRYWGAPIPVVYDPEGKAHPVKEEHLPWTLPTDVDFKPTGESPLKSSKEFVERTERLYGKGWRPEYDTMDTFVDSSWYYLRYTDARNENEFASKEQLAKWLPVDFYMIGPEHIVLHLLYARFFTKFLRDEGYFSADEPFKKMRHQGMILGPDHKKMSKSKGNVIDPDTVISEHGADTLRMYEMFMGPIDADKPWSTTSVVGLRRFLNRIWEFVSVSQCHGDTNEKLRTMLHKTLKKVTEDIAELKFNTAIASMMEFVNLWESESSLSLEDLKIFVRMMAPFAPFMAEELWQTLGITLSAESRSPLTRESVHLQDWPMYDLELTRGSSYKIVVQVNGKLRYSFDVPVATYQQMGNPQDTIVSQLGSVEVVQKWLADKNLLKTVFIPPSETRQGLINFVVN